MPEIICMISTAIALIMGVMCLYSMLVSWRLFHSVPMNVVIMVGLCIAMSIFDYKSQIHHHGIKHAYVRILTTLLVVGVFSTMSVGVIDRFLEKMKID